jgi:hypothetical protein
MVAIQEIEARYGEKAGRIDLGWYETQDEVEPLEGPHANLFTAQLRAKEAHTRMGERAQANTEEYCKEHRDSSHILLSYHLMTLGGCIPID